MLSGQQGKEAEHGHPAIETFAVGMEPKAGQTPLGHQAWLERRRGGGHRGSGNHEDQLS